MRRGWREGRRGEAGGQALTVSLTQVKDPEKYGFSPKQLLSQLTDIYLHLSSVELARAVAQDEV